MPKDVRFLVDADLPRATASLAVSLGYDAVDVRDVGMGSADDPNVSSLADREQRALLTGDFGFADIRNYPPADHPGIAVICVDPLDRRDQILDLIRSFLTQQDLVAQLPGRLAIVEKGRVRFRPRLTREGL